MYVGIFFFFFTDSVDLYRLIDWKMDPFRNVEMSLKSPNDKKKKELLPYHTFFYIERFLFITFFSIFENSSASYWITLFIYVLKFAIKFF